MGLRIRTNISTLHAQRSQAEAEEVLSSQIEKSSQYKQDNLLENDIHSPLQAKFRSMSKAKREAKDGLFLIQLAKAGFKEAPLSFGKHSENFSEASSEERKQHLNQEEYFLLLEEIDRLGQIAEINDQHLLQGKKVSGVKKSANPLASTPVFDLNKFNIDSDFITKNQDFKPKVLQLDSFKRKEEYLGVLQPKYDESLDPIDDIHIELGKKQSRLHSTISKLAIAEENMIASQCKLDHTDFKESCAAYTKRLMYNETPTQEELDSFKSLLVSLLR